MLQIETIKDSYSFHSYDNSSAKIIKPDRDIHSSPLQSNQGKEVDLLEISITTLIYKDQLKSENFPEQFEQFNIACIDRLTQYDADIFLIGTGSRALFPDKTILQYISKNKLAIDFMDTGAACRTFNILTGEYRKVAALIFFSLDTSQTSP